MLPAKSELEQFMTALSPFLKYPQTASPRRFQGGVLFLLHTKPTAFYLDLHEQALASKP